MQSPTLLFLGRTMAVGVSVPFLGVIILMFPVSLLNFFDVPFYVQNMLAGAWTGFAVGASDFGDDWRDAYKSWLKS